MQDIISLFRKFNNYSTYSDYELSNYLSPSIKLNQYKKHYNENNLVGFTNWALLSDKAENKILSSQPFNDEDWNSGNNLWHIETVSLTNIKKIISWTKNNLASKYGVNRLVKWIRVNNNKIRTIKKVYSKDSWLWAE
nr:ACP:hemolysin acyltransferase (hemolysin-activating protein) (HlyC) [uncultured Mediterranean phage uvMED]